MPVFKAVEFIADTVQETGNVEIYDAESREEAVDKCLYTKRLSDGNACIGPSGYVVRTQAFAWAIVQPRFRKLHA